MTDKRPQNSDFVQSLERGLAVIRAFDAEKPNQRWVCDITYVPTGEGWLYLAAVMDLCSRKIVGWSLADHMKTTPSVPMILA